MDYFFAAIMLVAFFIFFRKAKPSLGRLLRFRSSKNQITSVDWIYLVMTLVLLGLLIYNLWAASN